MYDPASMNIKESSVAPRVITSGSSKMRPAGLSRPTSRNIQIKSPSDVHENNVLEIA
jgi:hypothetical protein